MKIDLRYCWKCKRDTLQAKKDYPTHGFGWEKLWYCPICGSAWGKDRYPEDREIKIDKHGYVDGII